MSTPGLQAPLPPTWEPRPLDLIAVGRCMVDLYCDQAGAPLAQGQSLSMYIGGCPTNIAVGTRRQGLQVAMLTRVGGDRTGQFVVTTLQREGIDTSHVHIDVNAHTPMVLAGIEPPDHVTLTWYRERSADLEVVPADYSDAFVGRSKALLLSGNTLSRPHGASAARHLVDTCARTGTRVVYDIDFRPALWVCDTQASSNSYPDRTPVEPAEIAQTLQSVLNYVDLLVGTEEEYCALMGVANPKEALEEALQRIRGLAILKKGKDGACVAWRDAAGKLASLEAGGFAVRVFNTLGAGDAFISGFLAGWLRGAPLQGCLERANASGAMVVTRHGCSPAMPYDAEIRHFLQHTSPRGVSPQDDPVLSRLHAAGARPPRKRPLCILAIDHRSWFEDLTDPAEHDRIRHFKVQAVAATQGHARANGWQSALGFILDGQFGETVLRALRHDPTVWTAEPLEEAGAFPLRVLGDGGDPGLALRERPRGSAVKVLVWCTANPALWAGQVATLRQVHAACVAWSRELLVELLERPEEATALNLAGCMHDLLDVGVTPDYWKLPLPRNEAAWQAQRAAVVRDPVCQGVLFLGGNQPLEQLASGLQTYVDEPLVLGFAVGRTLFEPAFRAYMEAWASPQAESVLKSQLQSLSADLETLARPWVTRSEAVQGEAHDTNLAGKPGESHPSGEANPPRPSKA